METMLFRESEKMPLKRHVAMLSFKRQYHDILNLETISSVQLSVRDIIVYRPSEQILTNPDCGKDIC